MKKTKLILTRTALVLFVLLMAQSAWAGGPTYFYKLAGCRVTLTAGDQEVTLSANQDGLTGGLSMVYTGEELKPTVKKVECEQFKNNENNSQGYKDVTGMFDVAYSNNLYATESDAAAGTKPTITLTPKAANAASFIDAESVAQVVKYFFIEEAAAVSFSAEPLVTEREYNGKPWTIADLKINGVPEGHTFTGVEATFASENATTPGFVGTYTFELTGTPKISLGGIDVTDCFEDVSLDNDDNDDLTIEEKPIIIKAKDQHIFFGQDIVSGTSQVEIYTEDEEENLVPATLAEGDVLSEITLTASSLDVSAEDATIEADGAVILNKDGDEVTDNYDIVYADGELEVLEDVVIVTITGHNGTFVYDGEEHTVTGYECAITYQSEVPVEDQKLTPSDITYNGTPSVSLTDAGSEAMGLSENKFEVPEGYDVHWVITDGSITITPAPVTVAIVGAKKSIAYNGDTQTISGYTATANNAIYDVINNIDYVGTGDEPTLAAIDAGKYWMEIDAADFENNNPNFDVYFMVPDDGDGYLEILPINAKVTIKGKTKTRVYDGKELTVEGWKATANTELYHVDTDFVYYGEVNDEGYAFATLTDVLVDDETGEVLKEYMGLDAAYFANINPNFETVEFVVTDGWQEVTKRPVTITITGNTAKYEYDAEQHEVKGFVPEISDKLYKDQNEAAAEKFYAPKEDSGSAKATAARTEIGITYMGMKAEDWENFNTNYEVTFEVTDGSVTISYHVASLADDTDNTSTIDDIVADYKGMADVTLADRTLYKDGSWNTICLPFDVDIEDSPLAGADVRQLTGASYEEGTLTLEFTAVTEIKAGEPYIIKWEEGNNLVNPVFKGVEVVAGLSEARFDIGEEMALTFKGTYAPVKYTSENKSILLVGDNSALYYPESGAFTNPQRAFFELEGIEVGDVESNAIGLRLDGATRINMQTTASDAVYYDLSGRRVNGQPAEAGIYIVNGKKVMIK